MTQIGKSVSEVKAREIFLKGVTEEKDPTVPALVGDLSEVNNELYFKGQPVGGSGVGLERVFIPLVSTTATIPDTEKNNKFFEINGGSNSSISVVIQQTVPTPIIEVFYISISNLPNTLSYSQIQFSYTGSNQGTTRRWISNIGNNDDIKEFNDGFTPLTGNGLLRVGARVGLFVRVTIANGLNTTNPSRNINIECLGA